MDFKYSCLMILLRFFKAPYIHMISWDSHLICVMISNKFFVFVQFLETNTLLNEILYYLCLGMKSKTLRNNTATFTCSHYFLSFEVINWLFYHLLFRWILCKKQSLTTHLECPFPQRRNKLFLVMSASFALIQMWVSPFHCSL